MPSLPIDPEPYFQLHVFCCTNERPENHPRGSCARKNSAELRDYLKIKARQAGVASVRVNNAGCLDRCELGPVMVIYPEGIWYTYQTKEDVDEIVRTHLVEGGRVERLLLRPGDKLTDKLVRG